MTEKYAALYVVDANVLIDYSNTDLSILSLVSQHVSEVFVPLPLLSEVDGLDESRCQSAGIQVVVPTLDQATEAANRTARVLSFQDYLCFVVARDSNGACVTNDRRLRAECSSSSIPTVWGLELLHSLVAKNALTIEAAIEVAKAIRDTNPFITDKLVAKFEQKLKKARQRAPKKGGSRKNK